VFLWLHEFYNLVSLKVRKFSLQGTQCVCRFAGEYHADLTKQTHHNISEPSSRGPPKAFLHLGMQNRSYSSVCACVHTHTVSICIGLQLCMDTHTHASTHTCAHTHITHTHSNTHTLKHTHRPTHTRTYTPTLILTHIAFSALLF